MKIEDLHPGAIPIAPAHRRPAPSAESAPTGGTGPAGPPTTPPSPATRVTPARVELSPRSRELHRALEAARGAPDVRPDRVDEVRRRLAGGAYRLDPAAIARAILEHREEAG